MSINAEKKAEYEKNMHIFRAMVRDMVIDCRSMSTQIAAMSLNPLDLPSMREDVAEMQSTFCCMLGITTEKLIAEGVDACHISSFTLANSRTKIEVTQER